MLTIIILLYWFHYSFHIVCPEYLDIRMGQTLEISQWTLLPIHINSLLKEQKIKVYGLLFLPCILCILLQKNRMNTESPVKPK